MLLVWSPHRFFYGHSAEDKLLKVYRCCHVVKQRKMIYKPGTIVEIEAIEKSMECGCVEIGALICQSAFVCPMATGPEP